MPKKIMTIFLIVLGVLLPSSQLLFAATDLAPSSDENKFREAAHLKSGNLSMVPVTLANTQPFTRDLFEVPAVMQWYEVCEVRTAEKHGESAAAYVERRMKVWVDRWKISPFSWWALHSGENFIGGLGCGLVDASTNPRIEVAYLFNNNFWRGGFATCALNLFFSYAVERSTTLGLAFNHFYAPVHPENLPSIGLLEKLDFVRDFYQDKIGEAIPLAQKRFVYVLSRDYERQRVAKPFLYELLHPTNRAIALICLYL
jgi:RimJ/RimL family protein N-acetyltransferase